MWGHTWIRPPCPTRTRILEMPPFYGFAYTNMVVGNGMHYYHYRSRNCNVNNSLFISMCILRDLP
jgi:hypothetical protein